MRDLLIVGTGPAGVSAALTAKARGLDCLWFGSRALSAKIAQAPEILNYPGLGRISGQDFAATLRRQIDDMGLAIREERIDAIYAMGDYYAACVNETVYEARTVILAVGVSAAKTVPGELENVGNGVSYCATCDGELYRGKTIAVVSTSREFEEEVQFLTSLAGKVYLSRSYAPEAALAGNTELMSGLPTGIERSEGKLSVVYRDRWETVDGIFFLKDSVSPWVLLQGLEMDGPHIRVDRAMKTNLPGCFAAGDCTGRPYQYVKAAGEGNIAAHSAIKHLHEMTRPRVETAEP